MPGHELRPGGVRGAVKLNAKSHGSDSSRSDDTTKSCRVCGRALRSPVSRERGIGPRCAKGTAPLPLHRETIDAPEPDIPGQRHLFDEEDPR